MKLYILCGPVGCGKSTFARKKAEDGAIIVNDDAIVTLLHGGNYTLYNKELKPLYKGVEQSIISHAICSRRDIVVDRPNYSMKMRRRYLGMAKSADYQVVLVLWEWIDPLVSAQRRFESDPRGHSLEHWIEAAQRHYSLYEHYNPEVEDFDDIILP